MNERMYQLKYLRSDGVEVTTNVTAHNLMFAAYEAASTEITKDEIIESFNDDSFISATSDHEKEFVKLTIRHVPDGTYHD